MRLFVPVLAATLLVAVPLRAEDVNVLEYATEVSGDCGRLGDDPLKTLTDGDPNTALQDYRLGACELIFRFGAPVSASHAILSTVYPGEGKQNKTSFVSVWGSHQSFGSVFYKLGQTSFPPDRIAQVAFGEPVKFRSLKILLEFSGKDGWPRGSSGADMRLNDIAVPGSKDTASVSRWPQQPMAALKGLSDPIQTGMATQCDELAGLPFNPDSYGNSRSDADLDVPEALRACEIATAEQPESVRLTFNLARVELLAERAPQAIARMTSPLLSEYAPAQFLLAKSFEEGTGVVKSRERAEALYGQSAAQDFGPALAWLAEEAYKEKAIKIAAGTADPDDKAVEPNLKRAIEIGYLPAMKRYFEHAMKFGLVTVREGYELLEQAAEQGDSAIMGEYASNMWNGYKINRRFADSRRYSLRAATLNRHFSMANYALDDFSNNRWYWSRRAAYSGEYWPLERFAKSIDGTDKQAFFAKMAFSKALQDAEEGDHYAMEWLAQYYVSGFGTEKNPQEAKTWRCRARAAGNPLALESSLPSGTGECGDE